MYFIYYIDHTNSLLMPIRGRSKSGNCLKDMTPPSLPDVSNTNKSGYGFFQSLPLYTAFGNFSAYLWHLWELAITGEPILIYAHDQEQCSMAVLSLVGLIYPVTYCGDYRPFFTIYDQDYKEIVNMHNEHHGNNMPSMILGVTNPFILKV